MTSSSSSAMPAPAGGSPWSPPSPTSPSPSPPPRSFAPATTTRPSLIHHYKKGETETLRRVLDEIDVISDKRTKEGLNEFNFTLGVCNCVSKACAYSNTYTAALNSRGMRHHPAALLMSHSGSILILSKS